MWSEILLVVAEIIVYILSIIGFLFIWVCTVGVFTKPDNDKFKDYVKDHFRILRIKNNVRQGKWLYLLGKDINSVVDSTKFWIVLDYCIFKIGAIRIDNNYFYYIGCFNNWYYVPEDSRMYLFGKRIKMD
jgi:hypothetical protein